MTGMPSNGEKRQRFSMRKLSVGLVSAAIGSFILFAPLQASASADQVQAIQYKYVTESELTSDEWKMVVRELPKMVDETDDTYYLVYRPKQGLEQLPNTGSSHLLEAALTIGGLALLLLAVKKGKDGRRKVTTLIVLTSLGSQLVMPSASALTNIILSAYNQELAVSSGQELPKPREIEGYDYVGYLKSSRGQKLAGMTVSQKLPEPDSLGDKEGSKERAEQKEQYTPSIEGATHKSGQASVVVPETPVVAPDQPSVVVPETPVVVPDQPSVVVPETPVVAPDQPSVVVPDTPVEQPDQPSVVVPDTPVKQPDQPSVVVPDTPVEQPDQPSVVVPETPVVAPEQPSVVIPETPVVAPDQPSVEVPETPVVAPDQPSVVVPETPVVAPEQPSVVVPETPVVVPDQPSVVVPETPVVQPVIYRDVTQTLPVAFEVQEIEDPSLEVGQSVLAQEGQLGQRSIVTRQAVEDGQIIGNQVVSDTIIQAAIPQIVKIGTKPIVKVPDTAPTAENPTYQVKTEDRTKVEELPFESHRQDDATLLKGSEVLVQKGQNGQRTILERDHLIDGQVALTEIISDTVTKLPVPEIIKVGTRIETKVPDVAPVHQVPHLSVTTQDVTVTSVIPYEKKREGSEELPVGEVKLVQAGQDGQRSVVTRQYFVENDLAYSEIISDGITKEPVSEIVLVGTKILNPELTYQETREEVALPFTTERRDNPELLLGQEVISQAGRDGLEVRVIRRYFDKGQFVREEVVTQEVTQAALPQIIQVGTKVETAVPDTAPVHEISDAPVVTEDSTSTETLPYETERVDNAQILKGQEVISQAGQNGSRTVVTRTHKVGDEILKTEIVSDVTVAPVKQIIQVGTKVETAVPDTAPVHEISDAKVVTDDSTSTEALPYETERVDNAQILKGQEVVSQAGQNGSRTVVTRTHKVGDEILKTEIVSDITVAPVKEIIQVGTKVETAVPDTAPVHEISDAKVVTDDSTSTEALPFETERVDNAQILKGQEVVSQAGQNGSRTVVTRTHKVGDEILKTEIVSDITVAPVKQIIQVGTKVETVVPDTAPVHEITEAQVETEDSTSTESLPFETKRVETDRLPQGEEKIIQPGQEGSRRVVTRSHKVGDEILKTEVISDTTVPPTDRIIEVGTAVVKEKPVVTITNLTKDEDKKAITASYSLQDPTNAYVSALAQVYKGTELVKEVAIPDPKGQLTLDGLDYYTDYTLKTKLTYALSDGNHLSTEESQKDVFLEYKKIEFKDIDTVELYGKDGQTYRRYLSLETAPTNLDQYYVKVKSSKFKELILPVSAITEDGNDFKVTVAFDQLVQDNQKALYDQNYSFNISKAAVAEAGVYTSFAQLVKAIQANPAGTYVIGADMTAEELAVSDAAKSYISGDFTGKLTGNDQGKQYAIYNLKKPLFDNLKGATVTGLDLKEVNLASKEEAGALAARSNDRTVITDVAVQGSLTGQKNLGGLVGTANMTQLENVVFKGSLIPTGTTYNAGGIVGSISGWGFSHVKKADADVQMTMTANNTNQKAGALAGLTNSGAWVADSVASGTIVNTGPSGQVGGMVGSTWNAGVISNLISTVTVTGGHASTGDQYDSVDARNVRVAGAAKASRSNEKFAKRITTAEGLTAKAGLGITASLDDTGRNQSLNQHRTDYLSLPNAQSNRQLAYENMEKLLPFYNKETLVYYGNKVDLASKLATTALLDVVPMVDHQPIMDPAFKKAAINRLMLHFADGTVSYQDVTYKEDFKNAQVAEYSLAGTDLLYTPEHFLDSYAGITSQVLPVLNAIAFDSAEVRMALGLAADASLDDLYLDRGFEATKQDLADELVKVLSTDKGINTLGTAVADQISQKIKDNAAAFLLGLSYLNRWYNISFGDLNAKDLHSYKFDFFGNQAASTLDTIIALGNSGFNNLKASNNLTAYNNSLASATGKASLSDYLESERQLFLPDKTNNEWLKENSKAYIVETSSAIPEVASRQKAAGRHDKEALGVYDRITQANWSYRNMLLPLLSLPEKGVFVISNMSTLSFGTYDRYKDKDSNGKVRLGEELNAYVEAKVDQAAIWQRDHFDFWYHVLTPESREKLFNKVLNYDGFWLKDDQGKQYWAALNDQNSSSIHDFFGPVGKHYNGNGSGAYATGSLTHFVVDRILDQYGTSVFTHEMTHNFDGSVYFGGKGRREGQGAENYALGMLQSADSVNNKSLVLNTVFKGDKDSQDRFQVYDPTTRFQSAADLKEYTKGMMDLLYLLDYLEGDAIVHQSDAVKQKWFRKIENYYVKDDKTGQDTHAGNSVRPLTAEEVAKLQNFTDLIDGDIINRRDYWDQNKLGRNGYYTVSMFSPIYAGLSNPNGSPGDLMFRRMAYELLADKGYQDGFLPYVSGLYTAEALAAGEKTYSSWHGRDVGRVTDDRVLKNVYGSEYASWADFKKAKFQDSVDKAKVSLRPITIRYEERQPNSDKTVTITSFEDLKRLMDGAVALDMGNIDRATTHTPASWVNLLKNRIYNAYLRDTDDFRVSIFDN